MAKSVVICEKASQAKDIKAAVGSTYGPVLPARGHILTLKEPHEVRSDWKDWDAELLWPNTFYPKKPVPGTQSLLSEIKRQIADAEQVIIATDCDREGQLIGDEILDFLGYQGNVKRAMFTAQDPKTLRAAFKKLDPNEKWQGLYMAGQAREQADQVTNLSLTRTATTVMKAPGGKGAIGIGRVKSPVLGIVCKRELEILNFVPEDMFEIDAQTKVESGTIKLTCSRLAPKRSSKEENQVEEEVEEGLEDGEEALAGNKKLKGRIMDRRIADALAKAAKGHEGPISVKSSMKKQGPPKLFDLSGMQAACSARFGWTGQKTLDVAQSLYASPHHLITYPRGEAQYLPENDVSNVPKLTSSLLNMNMFNSHKKLLSSPKIRKGKSGHFSDAGLAGFSHYAIVPNINAPEDFAKAWPKLNDDQKKLFGLISKQYLAAFAPDYEYRQTDVELIFPWQERDWKFANTGRVPIVMGWKEILGSGKAKDEPDEFPPLKNGENAKILDTKVRTVTTKPPARYTEGALIKAMKEAWRLVDDPKMKARLKEATGIGTAATRGTVLEGLFKQGQLMKKGKSIMPSEGGLQLYETLMKACPNVVDPGRTAIWETIFDLVQNGKVKAHDAVVKINETTLKEIENIRSSGVKIDLGGSKKPSAAMINAAKAISNREGIKLPKGILSDMGKCRAFLEEHMGERERNEDGTLKPFPPSPKQMQLAENLVDQTGMEIPDAALESSKELSAWIDKAMKKIPPRPPSENQIKFAEKIAEEKGIKLPDKARNDMKSCSAFIDKHKGKGHQRGGNRRKSPSRSGGNSGGMSGRPPSEKQIALADKLASQNDIDLPDEVRQDMGICSDFIKKYIGNSKMAHEPR